MLIIGRLNVTNGHTCTDWLK